MSDFSDRALEGMGEAFRDRAGPLLPPIVEALTGPAADVDDLVTPSGPSGAPRWSRLDETPVPATLGAATGTRIPSGLTLEQQRTFLREQPARRRGSAASIIAAARAAAPGRRVDLFERLGSPWNLQVRLTGGADVQVTNLALDPRTPTPSPNDVHWTITPGATISGHPLGHTQGTEVRRTLGQVTHQIASVYSLDGLFNSPTNRYVGTWVKANTPCIVNLYMSGNYAGSLTTVEIPADTWVWITTPAAGTAYTGLEAFPTRGSVLDSDRFWIGGVRVSATPVDDYFDGDTPDKVGMTYAWTGTPEASSSTRTPDTAAVVRAAVALQKPVGITLDVVIVPGATFAHFAAHHGATLGQLASQFATLGDLATHVPEGGTTP